MSIYAHNRTTYYWLITLALTIATIYYSGWREVGIDRLNYISNYQAIVSSEELGLKIFAAKDLIFLVIVEATNPIKDDPKIAFLIVNIIALLSKCLAFKKLLPSKILRCFLIYAIFASPGLEFAAIRAGMALGLMMLAIAYRHNLLMFTTCAVLSIAAHLSFLIPVLFCMPILSEKLKGRLLPYILIAVVAKLASNNLAEIYPTGADYADNAANLIAYTLPIFTLFITFILVKSIDLNFLARKYPSTLKSIITIEATILGLTAIAFGLTGDFVTAATRYLEICWTLLIVFIFIPNRNIYLKILGTICWLILMSYVNLNVNRQTWLAIVSPAAF